MGGSFGSHWSMAILRNHPELVARALLSAMEGPDHTYDHPGWILNAQERVAAWPSDMLRLIEGRWREIAPRAIPDPGAEEEWNRIPNAAFFLLDCASGISEERGPRNTSTTPLSRW